MKIMKFLVCIFCLIFNVQTRAQENINDAALNLLLEPGVHALMRHAYAPGVGDPSNFKLDDCSTQRNLNAEGKQQAIALGQLFKQHNVNITNVFSSQWCRCLDTAKLMDLANVEMAPELNSFFEKRNMRGQQTDDLIKLIKSFDQNTKALLISHQVNITALTGVYPKSGEIVLIKLSDTKDVAAQTIEVLGSIEPSFIN